MPAVPVIAVFDIGKTNKKLFLFDEEYKIVFEACEELKEIEDEDGFPCEDVNQLSSWVQDRFALVLSMKGYEIKAVNFSAYGASFVHLGANGKPVAPLYNYLKPLPPELENSFYKTYGGAQTFALETASPVLGNLNSGMQLYWLKQHQQRLFEQIQYALHLPQYLSYLITGKAYSDITSIGCHTGLWNFKQQDYHRWVKTEGIYPKLAPLYKCNDAVDVKTSGHGYMRAGAGLHDSSTALIPYLLHFQEPFVLISTGTWCISLNPFNHQPLTGEELKEDCLCYLTYKGAPVKAARAFLGYEHEQQVRRIAAHFGIDDKFYNTIAFDAGVYARIKDGASPLNATALSEGILKQSQFALRGLSQYGTPAEAYHQLMSDLVCLQYASANLVLQGSPVKRIFVDGGFSKNNIYMHLLAAAFSGIDVYAASVAQASALGAALVLHRHWNKGFIPPNIIELDHYPLASSGALL